MTVVLGLDPGSINLGYGVIEVHGNRLTHRDHGTLSSKRGKALSLRLAELFEGLTEVLDRQAPDAIAIERVFMARNVSSALTLGHARGMILTAVGQRDLELAEYAPSEVKLAVCGHGRGSKDQVEIMVRRLLGLDLQHETSDSSDALAIAVCHAHSLGRQRVLRRVGRAR